ncbi:MAG: tetratricopeptide repeat protein, partial [Bacteroidia bacterium]|nr:tetratricopeptide repeat protein [Bacteroidia bacterium]
GNAKAWNNRGNVFSELGKNTEALNDYNKAIELAPDEKDYKQNRDALLKQMNEPKQDAKKQNLSFMEEQLLPQAYGLFKSGDYKKALEIFQQLQKIAGDEGNIKAQLSDLNNAGLCYMKLNDLKKAGQIFSKMILDHPDYVNAYSNLSLIYKKQGNIRLAKDFIKKAIEFDPSNVKYQDELKSLESKEN